MGIYQLDLDLLETACKGYEESAERLRGDIEALYGTVAKTSEDIYSGTDGDTFRSGLTNYTQTRFTSLWEETEKLGKTLLSGLEGGCACRKICNDFILALGGESCVSSAQGLRGMLYCDQEIIMELKDLCRKAVMEAYTVRESADAIDDILSGLSMSHINSYQYTNTIREGCDKVERLEQHSLNLTSYAVAVESADDSLWMALSGSPFPTMSAFSFEIMDPQTKTVSDIMNQPVDHLSDADKEILDKNLRILIENNEISELEKLAEQMGTHPKGWTAGDIYVAARILDFSENNCSERAASAVYDRMKKVTLVEKTSEMHNASFVSSYTVYIYEVSLDETISERILNELHPDTNGLTYYSLQRRRNYTERVEKIVQGLTPQEPGADFTISFKSEDGRLVSIFETKEGKSELSSVDMNTVLGKEGIACLGRLGFTPSEKRALMSCIYTDEDIAFIGELANADTEQSYRKVFQSCPDDLSVYTKLGLYNYSLALLDKNIQYNDNLKITSQNLDPLEHFVNGMLYRKSDSSMYDDFENGIDHAFTIDYRDGYLQSMIMAGEIQMDAIKNQMKNNYKDSAYIRENLPVFDESAQMLSLYSTLACRQFERPDYSMENYIRISNLDLDNNAWETILGEDMNQVMFSYLEEIMYDDQPISQSPVAEIEIIKSSGKDIAVDYLNADYVKKATAAKYALPKEILGKCVTSITDSHPKLAIVAKSADLIESGVSIINAYQEVEETGDVIYSMLGGTQISYKEKDDFVFKDPVAVIGGQYDANAFIKMTWLENEGLKGFPGVDTQAMETISKKIETDIIEKDQSLYYRYEKDIHTLYEQYILIQGKPYIETKENQYKNLVFPSITPDNVINAINNIEDSCASALNGLDYIDYNIINNYYLRNQNES